MQTQRNYAWSCYMKYPVLINKATVVKCFNWESCFLFQSNGQLKKQIKNFFIYILQFDNCFTQIMVSQINGRGQGNLDFMTYPLGPNQEKVWNWGNN